MASHDNQRLATSAPKPDRGFLIEQAEEIKARGGYFVERAEEVKARANELTEQTTDHQADRTNRSVQTDDGSPKPDSLSNQEDLRDQPLNLPMGIWVGFHDGETPLMARLAVHDPDGDYYVFVNRKGVKMRQLNKQELLKLIEDDLVDILETHTNFRKKVTEVRKNRDQ
jgi:hypothetical protein